MIEKFVALLGEWVKTVISAGGYKGIFALLALTTLKLR